MTEKSTRLKQEKSALESGEIFIPEAKQIFWPLGMLIAFLVLVVATIYGDASIPDDFQNWKEALIAISAIASGGIGGCARFLREFQKTMQYKALNTRVSRFWHTWCGIGATAGLGGVAAIQARIIAFPNEPDSIWVAIIFGILFGYAASEVVTKVVNQFIGKEE